MWKKVSNLLCGGQVQSEGNARLLLVRSTWLVLFPNEEIAIGVEDKQVGEVVHEDVVVGELLAPRLVEVYDRQRPRGLDKEINHLFLINYK
jgi:hypothetical protein